MIHSFADVGNQVLLKVGEVRGRGAPDTIHPFGRGQEKFFWALVSAVSVFFIGCGINIYHGVHALLLTQAVEPFTPLIVGLLLFALALESWTFSVALKEIGGWAGVRENRTNTTVLAVLLEDAVALLGILLTLVVAGCSYVFGPTPVFDAAVAIAVGLLLGVMAMFLAALNRRLLIDTSDPVVDRAAQTWLAERSIRGKVSSLVLDDDRAVVFVRAEHEVRDSFAVGEALKAQLATTGKTIDAVFWKFAAV
jgi:zinc transporter 9